MDAKESKLDQKAPPASEVKAVASSVEHKSKYTDLSEKCVAIVRQLGSLTDAERKEVISKNESTISEVKALDDAQQILLFQQMLHSRPEADAKYELDTCEKRALPLAQAMASQVALRADEKDTLFFFAQMYKIEMLCIKQSSVPEFTESGEPVPFTKTPPGVKTPLQISRDSVAYFLSEVCRHRGLPSLIAGRQSTKGTLAEVACDIDTYNAVTNPKNPAKLGNGLAKKVGIQNDEYDVACKEVKEGSLTFYCTLKNGSSVTLNVPKGFIVKNPNEAFSSIKFNQPGVLKRALGGLGIQMQDPGMAKV